ncbi:MAG: outer membrane protein assembly factor BamB [Gammaproteobacteria bacterium]|nr:MAG: outer membrane protein assembly factor BamB [Gammaproteobacteria bacterium]
MMVFARASRVLLVAGVALSLSACSSMKDFFSIGRDNPRAPVDLEDIEATVKFKTLWSTSVGNGQGKGYYRLTPALDYDKLFVVSADGELRALNSANGKKIWERDLQSAVSGGIGLYDDSVFLGLTDGAITRLDASTGATLWTKPVSGEILAAPQSDGDVVVMQSYNGEVQAFDYETGDTLWTYQANVPVLTLRGTSTPLIEGSLVIVGFANGRVMAFDTQSGAINWEFRVSLPSGRSEIERISDVDGAMLIDGGVLYVVNYQGNVVAADVASGRKLWQLPASSFSGVAEGFGNVYVAQENGAVMAAGADGSGLKWEQDALGWRKLSRPTPVSSYIAVGDYRGYIHLLSQVDGAIVGRTRVDSDGQRADMLADGDVLYVFGNDGELKALQVQELE